MARVKLCKGKQGDFLNRVAEYYDYDWARIAKISSICERSFRDWRREKYNMSYEALLKLHEISNIPIPKIVKILPEYWSARKFARQGALRRNQLYGPPGTPEGRRKGGVTSQRLFRANPEYAKRLGIKIRKDVKNPRLSKDLAEFIGIMLGDGGISNYQISITINKQTDSDYCVYIRKLIRRLFSISTSALLRSSDNAVRIVASARNLVEFLCKRGLKEGDKVKNEINIPDWILHNRSYSAFCLRGLIDTDGCFYSYKHKVYNKVYNNCAICFTNYSKPLLKSVRAILKNLGFNPRVTNKRVFLHRIDEINKYFEVIGTSNPKHLRRYREHISSNNS